MEDIPIACPKCNSKWYRVEGNKLICQCGYVEEVKRPDVVVIRKRSNKKPRKPSPEATE